MGRLVTWIDRNLYSQFENNWDDSLFRTEIIELLKREDHLLDVGAGAGIVPQMNFLGEAARVCGIDPDERVLANPYLNEGKIAMGENIPYQDEEFDVVIADNVLEHLERPEQVFKEIARVLKPGGVFLAKTPNKRHYMPLIARLTPLKFHQFVNRLRGRETVDTFPTQYKVNTPKAVLTCAEKTGLVVRQIKLIEGRPEYLRFFGLTYLIGWVYERAVNTIPVLARFRILMAVTLQKPSLSTRPHPTR